MADSAVLRMEEQYQQWINKHAHSNCTKERIINRINDWNVCPHIHVIMVHLKGREEGLADTIESLFSQYYAQWGLTILSLEEPFSDFFDNYSNIEWIKVPSEPQQYVNEVVSTSALDWICQLESGDQLAPHAFYAFVSYSKNNKKTVMWYSDEDSITGANGRCNANFKPDVNLELLRSTPYCGFFSLVDKSKLIDCGGYQVSGEFATYDLMFKIIEANGVEAVGHIDDVLFHRLHDQNATEQECREMAAKSVVERHLKRLGVKASVSKGFFPLSHHVDYQYKETPLVSIVIPTKDQYEMIKGCVDSLLKKTAYKNFEVIIVDNGTTEKKAVDYLSAVSKRDARVKVLTYNKIYNFAAINNFATSHAQGDYLLLLNNDTVIIQSNWLERMLGYALRDDVAIVGVRLLYPNHQVQHAGVVLGMSDVADHCHIGIDVNDPGYMGRAHVAQEMSAVTAACMMVSKADYMDVSGMDEQYFAVLFNDIDLCLKVKDKGKKIIWTPFVSLLHYGSMSLKQRKNVNEEKKIKERSVKESAAMLEKWLPALASDFAYNSNLSFHDKSMGVDTIFDVSWRKSDASFRLSVMALPFDEYGCGQYRVRQPLSSLAANCDIDLALMPNHAKPPYSVPGVVDIARREPDVLFIHNALHDFHHDMLKYVGRYLPHVKRIVGMDDLMENPPQGHIFRKTAYKDMKRRIRKTLASSDRLVVTTQPLADAYSKFIDDIVVIPNYLDNDRWEGLRSYRNQGVKPRVGWAGALQHQDDLELLLPVVKELADEVEWVFFGMCLDEMKPYVSEFHEGVPFTQYPQKLASLNLDLAVAPLSHHPYNEAKSNLKILEYGMMGWPVVCTNILPYQNAPVCRVPNNTNAWVQKIRYLVKDLDALASDGDAMKTWVINNWMLNDHLDEWKKALN